VYVTDKLNFLRPATPHRITDLFHHSLPNIERLLATSLSSFNVSLNLASSVLNLRAISLGIPSSTANEYIADLELYMSFRSCRLQYCSVAVSRARIHCRFAAPPQSSRYKKLRPHHHHFYRCWTRACRRGRLNTQTLIWWRHLLERILGKSRDIAMLLERRYRILLLLLAIIIPEYLLHRTVCYLCHLHLQCSLLISSVRSLMLASFLSS